MTDLVREVNVGFDTVRSVIPEASVAPMGHNDQAKAELGYSGRMSPYDIPTMRNVLAESGVQLVYEPHMTSTMDIANRQHLTPTVVVTDHQTAGRGRYNREWKDVHGEDVLATYLKIISRSVLPPRDSPVLSQLFSLAVWKGLDELLHNPEIRIRWPNDLSAYGQKLGGVLLMEGARDAYSQAIAFGVGINVHNTDSNQAFGKTDYGAISLDEIGPSSVTRGDIVVGIHDELALMLPDLAGLARPKTQSYYADLWNEASCLRECSVRISGIGAQGNEAVEGRVLATPFGGGIELATVGGGKKMIKEFGSSARLEVLTNG